MSPLDSKSLKKLIFTAKFLVRAAIPLPLIIAKHEALSSYMIGFSSGVKIVNSFNRSRIHSASFAASHKEKHSASVVD